MQLRRHRGQPGRRGGGAGTGVGGGFGGGDLVNVCAVYGAAPVDGSCLGPRRKDDGGWGVNSPSDEDYHPFTNNSPSMGPWSSGRKADWEFDRVNCRRFLARLNQLGRREDRLTRSGRALDGKAVQALNGIEQERDRIIGSYGRSNCENALGVSSD